MPQQSVSALTVKQDLSHREEMRCAGPVLLEPMLLMGCHLAYSVQWACTFLMVVLPHVKCAKQASILVWVTLLADYAVLVLSS